MRFSLSAESGTPWPTWEIISTGNNQLLLTGLTSCRKHFSRKHETMRQFSRKGQRIRRRRPHQFSLSNWEELGSRGRKGAETTRQEGTSPFCAMANAMAAAARGGETASTWNGSRSVEGWTPVRQCSKPSSHDHVTFLLRTATFESKATREKSSGLLEILSYYLILFRSV